MVNAEVKTRQLSAKQFEVLTNWLETKKINLMNSLEDGNIDLNAVASSMKLINKKFATTSVYTAHNNFALKLKNWDNFNLLVLRKMGVSVTRKQLEELAKSEAYALYNLLYQVMCAERRGFTMFTPRRSGSLKPNDNQVKTFRNVTPSQAMKKPDQSPKQTQKQTPTQTPKQTPKQTPTQTPKQTQERPKPNTSTSPIQTQVRKTAQVLARQTQVQPKPSYNKVNKPIAKENVRKKFGDSTTQTGASMQQLQRSVTWTKKSFKEAAVDCKIFDAIIIMQLETRMDQLNEKIDDMMAQQGQSSSRKQEASEQELPRKSEPNQLEFLDFLFEPLEMQEASKHELITESEPNELEFLESQFEPLEMESEPDLVS